MSNLRGRLDRIEKSIGAGEPFTEGVHQPDDFSFVNYGFFGVDDDSPYPPGYDQESGVPAPPGHQKLAELMGMSAAVMLVFSGDFDEDNYGADIEAAKNDLGLTGDESEAVALERFRELGLERGFNKAEMKELDRIMAGTYGRQKGRALGHQAGAQS
jgi:hypothetical protein